MTAWVVTTDAPAVDPEVCEHDWVRVWLVVGARILWRCRLCPAYKG